MGFRMPFHTADRPAASADTARLAWSPIIKLTPEKPAAKQETAACRKILNARNHTSFQSAFFMICTPFILWLLMLVPAWVNRAGAFWHMHQADGERFCSFPPRGSHGWKDHSPHHASGGCPRVGCAAMSALSIAVRKPVIIFSATA